MERRSQLLFAACLATVIAATRPDGAAAAEDQAQAQDLVLVSATGPVTAARWARRPDSYVLHIVYDPSRSALWQQAAADRPAPSAATPVPVDGQNRGSYFIGNTIANLRGLAPAFCGRTLTLVDGRRLTDRQTAQPAPAPTPVSVNQPYPPKYRFSRVEVWLLKTDGTQILPATYSCDVAARPATAATPVEITYEFPLAGGEQAAAAAFRIDSDYYIEKLQPPSPAAAATL